MSKKIQEVFNRIQETKKEQKKIRDMYKDALANSEKYQKISEKLKELKEEKKKQEENIKEDFSKELDKLDTLKADLENDRQIMSDLVLNKISQGEKVEISDQNNTQYEPVFSVKFKKRT
ncbi:MAG TPA: hypothetical protein VKO42_03270 [Patescibacteria group bacterium]|nr:hypothetical protein [Patescibacteria group bacterium]